MALAQTFAKASSSAPANAAARKAATGFSAPEWLFVALLTALPAYVLPASYLLHAYRDIYVLSYAIGMGILLFTEQLTRITSMLTRVFGNGLAL